MGDLQQIIKDLHRKRNEAVASGLCSHCGKVPEYYSDAGRREFRISGFCEFCFDLVSDPELCVNCQKPESWHTHGRTDCECYKGPDDDGDSTNGNNV